MGKSIHSVPIRPSGLTNALAPNFLRSKAVFFIIILLSIALLIALAVSYTSAQNRSFTNGKSMQLEYIYNSNPKRTAETNALIQAVRESTDRSRPASTSNESSNSTSSQSGKPGSNYQVTVNGESINVPQNGSVNHTTSDGNVNVQVESHNSQTSSEDSSRSRNSSSINIKSSTKSTVTGHQKEEISIR